MAVRKIKNSWWIDLRHNHIRYRKRSPENSKAGAAAYEAAIRNKLAQGESLESSIPDPKHEGRKQKFKDFAWKWVETYAKTNNKFSELEHKRYVLRKHLIPFFGDMPVDQINTQLVEEYKSLKVGSGSLANKSINNQLNVLSKCLSVAQEWYDLQRLPKIRRLKVPPQKFDFLSPEESERLLANCSGIWREIIFTGLNTGLRRGELKALNWSDINWHNRTLTVRQSWSEASKSLDTPKSNRERHIPLTNELFEMFLRRKESTGVVFPAENGKRFQAKRLNSEINRACRAAGIREISCHALRHTFASHLIKKGASIKEIQELLGHANIQVTMRYAHLAPSSLRKAIHLLESDRRISSEFWATGGQPSTSVNLEFATQ